MIATINNMEELPNQQQQQEQQQEQEQEQEQQQQPILASYSYPPTCTSPRLSITLKSLTTAISNREWPLVLSTIKRFPALASEWLDVTIRNHSARLLPLHYVCTLRPPHEVVRLLLDANPDTASYTDRNGRYPLHWACDAMGASADIIEMLLRYHPESASKKEKKFGFLPLHIACYVHRETTTTTTTTNNNTTLTLASHSSSTSSSSSDDYDDEQHDVIRTLLNWYPDAASTVDSRGWLPLHVACRTGAAPSVISCLISINPHAGTHRDRGGRGPLHLACCHGRTSVRTLECLIQQGVGGMEVLQKKETKHGFLPLHVACSNERSSYGTIAVLLRGFAMGARVPDKNGSLPLHLACRANAPRNVIRALLDAFGEAASARDAMGRLPLHWACHVGASKRTVQALLEAHPEGAKSKEEKYDYLPLHVACLRGASENIIQALLRVYPQGTRMRDKNKCLPIHLSCDAETASGNVVSMLVRCYPESITELDGQSKTPKEILIASSTTSEINRDAIIRVLEGEYTMPLSTIYENQHRQILLPRPMSPSSPIKEQQQQHQQQQYSSKSFPMLDGSSKKKLNKAGVSKKSTSGGTNLCVICLEKPSCFILYPCGHACLCDGCAKNHLDSLGGVCPIGRCVFRDVVRVYGNVVGEN